MGTHTASTMNAQARSKPMNYGDTQRRDVPSLEIPNSETLDHSGSTLRDLGAR